MRLELDRQLILGFVATALPLLLASCNHSPIEGLEKSFTLKVQQDTGAGEAVKIDFLWVIDNSSSMCQEQVSLSESFSLFTEQLDAFFQIDARVAVTTHDAQCDVNGSGINSSKGLFNRVPATGFPPPCAEQYVRPCLDDDPCANLDCVVSGDCAVDDLDCTCAPPAGGALGAWECREPISAQCLENPNGTVNSWCTRTCETDAECRALFGDDRYQCNSASHGCILPPATEGCDAELPAVLEGDDLDDFRCIATVGVNQEKCFRYEEGMKSAAMALDTTGINADQAKAFLRDDAYLVIIFVTDEDDCSSADDRPLSEDAYEVCALLPTLEAGGPLTPVGHFVNRFKSLKQDPGRVIVAAIAGDSDAATPALVDAERAAYLASKGDVRDCYHQTYICLSDNGRADYSARYLDLTQSFGPNGVFTNICRDEGVGPALETIAKTIVDVLNKVCLPKPIVEPIEASLVVERTNADGTVDVLSRGDGVGTYEVVDGAEDCAVDGVLLPAIKFGDPPLPGATISISYRGDPQLN